jgi:23S rRNA (guanosine2251-2'-O)-methyltransferase
VRSCYSLGVDAVIATGVKQLNFPAIMRTSSGALLDMPFMVKHNFLDLYNELKQVGFEFYGASMDGESIDKTEFSRRRVLVLGSEGEGISKKAKSKLDKMVSIEMKREFNSLNVSAAAAILIHRMANENK